MRFLAARGLALIFLGFVGVFAFLGLLWATWGRVVSSVENGTARTIALADSRATPAPVSAAAEIVKDGWGETKTVFGRAFALAAVAMASTACFVFGSIGLAARAWGLGRSASG